MSLCPFPFLTSDHVSRQEVFKFFSNDSKDYAATKAEHSERIIELLQNRTVFFAGVITI